jgi:hypothetical protein
LQHLAETRGDTDASFVIDRMVEPPVEHLPLPPASHNIPLSSTVVKERVSAESKKATSQPNSL